MGLVSSKRLPSEYECESKLCTQGLLVVALAPVQGSSRPNYLALFSIVGVYWHQTAMIPHRHKKKKKNILDSQNSIIRLLLLRMFGESFLVLAGPWISEESKIKTDSSTEERTVLLLYFSVKSISLHLLLINRLVEVSFQ